MKIIGLTIKCTFFFIVTKIKGKVDADDYYK